MIATTGKNRETVLKRLLETQDAYILELEAKCKFMSTQLVDKINE
jgi:hypothetical protein